MISEKAYDLIDEFERQAQAQMNEMDGFGNKRDKDKAESALRNYISALEAENAALKERIAVYEIGIDPKIHPEPDTWVLMMDCDDDYFPVQFDPAMKRYWNYAESENNMNFWNDSDEDLSKWFPLPGKRT